MNRPAKDRRERQCLTLAVLVATFLGLIAVLMREGGVLREWLFAR